MFFFLHSIVLSLVYNRCDFYLLHLLDVLREDVDVLELVEAADITKHSLGNRQSEN